jgi:two-component system, cell cycle sensor histidine kinase and response regulator CckA
LITPDHSHEHAGNAMCPETSARTEETTAWCTAAIQNGLGEAVTILLVEDEAFVREVSCEVLDRAGYRVLSAKNSADAVCLYERYGHEIQFVITDVVLPDENGRVLAEKLRRRTLRDGLQLKILFVTGYTEQMGLRQEGSSECLAKPFSSEALLGRVRELLEEKKNQQ